MKTILVPTDFSKNSNNALKYAVALATEKKLKIILLHVFQSVEGSREKVTKPKTDKLIALSKEIALSNRIGCEIINKEGVLFNVIINTIHEIEPDFVIMGTKGARGIKEILMGSNAEGVIKNSKCPVIIVPKKETFSGINNITYATNYCTCSSANSIAVVLQLIQIAKIFNAKINIVEICDEECISDDLKICMNSFKEKINSVIDYKNITFNLIFGNNEELRLEEFSNATSSDLLAISTQNRILIDRLFRGGRENKPINRKSIPLMVLNHKLKSDSYWIQGVRTNVTSV